MKFPECNFSCNFLVVVLLGTLYFGGTYVLHFDNRMGLGWARTYKIVFDNRSHTFVCIKVTYTCKE